jgi:hypothetical protein
MAIEPSRKAALEATRFRAILRDRFDHDVADSELAYPPFGVAARAGDRAWVISSAADPGLLGGVLVWAARQGVERVDIIVEHHAGLHARRARTLAPRWRMWHLDGAEVRRAEVEPLAKAAPRVEGLDAIEELITRVGAAAIHEDGILRAEVNGLEVGRVVIGPGGPVLEAGVGRFDREAGVLLNVDRDPEVAIAAVVRHVAPHRQAGAPPHAIGRLARGRWLRQLVLEDPEIAGVAEPELVEPIPPRVSLLDVTPGALVGRDGDQLVLVVCSVGADLGLVPEIADLIDRHECDEVRIVVPARDRLASLEALVVRLPVPVTFRDVVTPW